MKKLLAIALLLLAAQMGTSLYGQTFTLSSPGLGGQFTNEFKAGNFGCSGSNQSPELHWTGAPATTQSFAITMYDADAPTGSGFWHWVLVDIPPQITQLKKGAGNPTARLITAKALHSINDTGSPGYQGPCPDEADQPHRYIITVYALNTSKLGTTANSTAALTGFLLNKAALAKASLMIYCKRQD